MSPDPSLDPNRTLERTPPIESGPPSTLDVTGALTSVRPPDSNTVQSDPDWPRIPGCEITALIARGGMGCVYAGRDVTLDREIAFKTLLPGADPNRFVTEAKITARLPHPGIPPIHSLGKLTEGGHYLAMKLIRGRTLADLLKERPSPAADLPRFVQVFEQIAQATGFAHSRGIIHRDLKPLNVMVGEFGEVQVMDWGLAKDTRTAEPAATGEESTEDSPDLTRAGTIMGTPGYMAPEQARGEAVDARADVFALGSVLAAILTGKPAFVGTTARETINKAAAADLADVLARLDQCGADRELVALARRCLAVEASDRPANAQAVAEEVADYRAGVESRLRQAETDRARAETQVAEQRKRRRIVQWAGGLIAAVLLLGIIGTTIGLLQATEAAENERTANGAAQTAKTAAEQSAKAEKTAADKERQAKEQAEQEKATALAVRDFLQTRLIRQANPFENSRWAFGEGGEGRGTGQKPGSALQRDLTVRELVERASQEFSPEAIARRFPDQPVVQAEILETIGETYEGLREYEKSIRFVEAAQAIRVKHLGPMHPASLTGHTNLMFTYLAAARVVDAVKGMIALGEHLDALLLELPHDSREILQHPSLAKMDAILKRMEERSNPHAFTYPKFELGVADAAWLGLHVPQLIGRVVRMGEEMGRRFGKNDRRTLVVEIWAAFAYHSIGQTRTASEMYEGILSRAEKSLTHDDRVLDGLREVLVVSYSDLQIKQPEMIRMLEQGYESRLKTVGPYHPSTLTNLHNLAEAYRVAGRLPEAIKLYEQVRDALLKASGADHAYALPVLHSLADAYRVANRLPEAIALFEQLRETRIKLLTIDHPETLSTLHSLGQTYQKAGRYPEAIKQFELVRDADVRNKMGAENHNALLTLVDLADCYRSTNKWSEAIAVDEQIRAAQVKAFGPEDPKTLATLVKLAQTYRSANQLPEAIKLFEQVRDARTKIKGADHADTLSALSNLALAYRNSNRFPEAIALYEQVHETRKKKAGPLDADTLIALQNLALAHRAAGQRATAIRLLEQVREGRTKTLGAENPDTLVTLLNLAGTYQASGRFPDAIKLFAEVHEVRAKTLGADHLDTFAALATLAGSYQAAGRLPEAIKVFERLCEAREKKLGNEDVDTLAVMNNLGGAYYAAGRIPDAIKIFERVRDGQVKVLGPEHAHTLVTFANLALMYRTAGRTTEAIALHEKVREAQERVFGPDHATTLSNLNNLAMVYEDANRLPEAIELYERVRDAKIKKLGADHLDTLITLNNLAGAYQSANRLPEAIELFERVLAAQEKKLGVDHSSNLTTRSGLAGAYLAAGRLADALPLFEQTARGIVKRDFQHVHAAKIIRRAIAGYEEASQLDKAEGWQRTWLAVVKERVGPNDPAYAAELSLLGLNLIRQRKWTDAETILRECLTLREKQEPDSWTTFNTQSMLGGALLGQKKYSDAEPLLVKGYAGMIAREKTMPSQSHPRLVEAADRLIELYTTLNKADEAAKWRSERAKYREAAPPPREKK